MKSHGISMEFSELDDKIVRQILDKYSIEEMPTYIRLWPDTVQIDADLSLGELQALTEIMRYHLDNQKGD